MRITGLCEINETSEMFSPFLYCSVLLFCYHITQLYEGINYSTLRISRISEIQVVPPWVGCPTLGKMSPNVPLWRVKCPTKSHLKKYFGPYFFRTVPNINIKETIILAGFVRISFKKKNSETCLTFGHIFRTTPN